MIRSVIIFVKIGLLVAAALYLSQYPGRVSVDWQGWRLDISVALLLLALAVVVIVGILLVRMWSGTLSVPGRFMSARRSTRRERGYKALTQGLVAVAAGDTNEAHRQARKADQLLNEPPLTRLLAAQAAQLEGDDNAAKRYFEQMLDEPDMAFLGLRGLINQAVKRGDRPEAMRLVKEANSQRPGTKWVIEALLGLQEEAGDLDGALHTANDAIRYKALPDPDIKAKKADIMIAKARECEDADDKVTALRLALEAHKLAPQKSDAAIISARLLAANGKNGKAIKLVEAAWKVSPGQNLARAYADLAPPSVDSLGQVKRFEHLLSLNPDHRESHLALAEAALNAKLWGEARNHLTRYVEDDPSPRLFQLLAQLEEAEHGDLDKARHWLNLATQG